MNLSEHFTLREMIRSDYALRHGIDNAPGGTALLELKALCVEVLEPIRAKFGAPVIVTSGYRSPAVNTGIGGSITSQHCKGQAADFTVEGHSNRHIMDHIMIGGHIPYDQVIYEFGEDGWIHISRADGLRWEALEAYKDKRQTRYRPYKPFLGVI